MDYNYYLGITEYIKNKTDNFVPSTAIILGSGLGGFAEQISKPIIIDYSKLKGFPVSTNKLHKGRFVLGYIDNQPVIAMEGRIHYYEGYSMEQVVLPVRIMKMLGASNLIITCAAGGINEEFYPGCLMMIKDHISSFVPSPLRGYNIEEFGTRFPDMTTVYDKDLSDIIKKSAKELNINLKEGTYLPTSGPNYETPAEIFAYKMMGADAVGMSTACEAMAATHCGMKVCGISCITNMAAGITGHPLSDDEVKEVALSSSQQFNQLLYKTITSIN